MFTVTVSYLDGTRENEEETFEHLADAKARGVEIAEAEFEIADEAMIEVIQITDDVGNVWCLEEDNGRYNWI